MTTREQLEQRAADVQRQLAEPAERQALREERARLRQQVAAAREAERRSKAEAWLLGNARAIGSLSDQLDKIMAAFLANPNDQDAERSQEVWRKVCRRLEWWKLLTAYFPGLKEPAKPVVRAPARRGIRTTILLDNAEPFLRNFHPIILASETPTARLLPGDEAARQGERAAQVKREAAIAWVEKYGEELPVELREILAVSR